MLTEHQHALVTKAYYLQSCKTRNCCSRFTQVETQAKRTASHTASQCHSQGDLDSVPSSHSSIFSKFRVSNLMSTLNIGDYTDKTFICHSAIETTAQVPLPDLGAWAPAHPAAGTPAWQAEWPPPHRTHPRWISRARWHGRSRAGTRGGCR